MQETDRVAVSAKTMQDRLLFIAFPFLALADGNPDLRMGSTVFIVHGLSFSEFAQVKHERFIRFACAQETDQREQASQAKPAQRIDVF